MKLSQRQLEVLGFIRDGDAFKRCRRQCDYGGRITTLWSLKRLGLVVAVAKEPGWKLTQQGRAEASKI